MVVVEASGGRATRVRVEFDRPLRDLELARGVSGPGGRWRIARISPVP